MFSLSRVVLHHVCWICTFVFLYLSVFSVCLQSIAACGLRLSLICCEVSLSLQGCNYSSLWFCHCMCVWGFFLACLCLFFTCFSPYNCSRHLHMWQRWCVTCSANNEYTLLHFNDASTLPKAKEPKVIIHLFFNAPFLVFNSIAVSHSVQSEAIILLSFYAILNINLSTPSQWI